MGTVSFQTHTLASGFVQTVVQLDPMKHHLKKKGAKTVIYENTSDTIIKHLRQLK